MFQIKKILTSFKKLRLLNLSSNPLANANNNTTLANSDIISGHDHTKNIIEYFHTFWHDFSASSAPDITPETKLYGSNLSTLILNSCFIDLSVIECLVDKLENLSELHLSSNNYSAITFSTNFVKPTLKILYFSNNSLTSWSEVCKLGKCFPSLENCVLSENNLANFDASPPHENAKCFPHLHSLTISMLKINQWSAIDQLREFPQLKHVRIQNIPLLSTLNDEEKHFMLVAHLSEFIDSLNGSKIPASDRETCERKYIRRFMDVEDKPTRYYELESKHGKLDKLADVNLKISKQVQVKIKYGDKHMYEKLDVRQTVGEFKKKLEEFVGAPSSRFRLFYIDVEATKLTSHMGTEELRLPNRRLHSLNVRDGDEFDIDLKP